MKYVQPHVEHILDDLAVLKARLPASQEAFMKDDLLQDAMLMRLIDIGEQLIRIRDNFPDVYEQHENDTWHKLIGVRNIIAHSYHEVNLDTIWEIVSAKLDGFAAQLQSLLKD